MSKLRDAYEFARDPDHFTVGAMARNAHGRVVSPESRRAESFCLLGLGKRFAFQGFEWLELYHAGIALFPQYEMAPGILDVIRLNDQLGHSAVIQMFEKAIVQTEGSL